MSNFLKKWILSCVHSELGSAWSMRIHQQLFATFPPLIEPKKEALLQQEIATGRHNARMIPRLDFLWPYWLQQQLNSESNAYYPATEILANHTHRNWTPLSAPGCDAVAWVDPRGLLTPVSYGWSLEVWIGSGKEVVSAASLAHVHQSLSPEKGVITTTFTALGIQLSVDYFLSVQSPSEGALMTQVSVLNVSQSAKAFSVFFAIRPYNPLGLAPIHDVVFLSNNTFVVDHRLGLVLDKKPDNVVCLSSKEGDVSHHTSAFEMILQTECPDHLATAFAEYKFTLKENEEQHLTAKLPAGKQAKIRGFAERSISSLAKQRLAKQTDMLQALTFKKEQEDYAGILQKDQSLHLKGKFPDKKVEKLFNLQLFHLLCQWSSDNFSSLRDFLPLVHSLNRIGHVSMVETALSQNYTLKQVQNALNNPYRDTDILALYVVALWDTFQVSRNKELLEKNAKLILKIIKQFSAMRLKSGLQKGLYEVSCGPDGVLKKDLYLLRCYEIMAAFKAAKQSFSALKKDQQWLPFSHLEQELWNAIQRHLKDIALRENQETRLFVSASRKHESLGVTSLASVYPLGLEKASEARILRTLQFLKRAFGVTSGLFLEFGEASGFNLERNLRLAQIYRLREETQAHSIIDWLTTISGESGSLPTSVNPKTNGGSAGLGHDPSSSAGVVDLIRDCCIGEDQGELHLLPFIPNSWIERNGELALENVSTSFGKVSFEMDIQPYKATILLRHEYHQKPKALRLSFPVAITEISADGVTRIVKDTSVTIPAHTQKIEFKWSSL